MILFIHFVSLNFMWCFKYSKTSGPFMSVSVCGRTLSNPFLQVFFRETTPGDGAAAAAAALHTLWEATPSAGWTVHQRQTGGFERRAATICSSIIDDSKRQQTKLTDFAILWKYSASFCRPVWKQMFQNKVSSGSRSLIWESADGEKVQLCQFSTVD